MQRYTIGLIKAATVGRGDDGFVYNKLADTGFVILAMSRATLCRSTIAALYGAHRNAPYFSDLIESVTGTVVSMILHHPTKDSVTYWREIMGPTVSKNAPVGTIRGAIGGHVYCGEATKVADNAVHGSDSSVAAKFERSLLFNVGICTSVDSILKLWETGETHA